MTRPYKLVHRRHVGIWPGGKFAYPTMNDLPVTRGGAKGKVNFRYENLDTRNYYRAKGGGPWKWMRLGGTSHERPWGES